jgi:hypothetical protein
MVLLVDRKYAMSFLKEIKDECPMLSGDMILSTPEKEKVQLQLKTTLDDQTRACLQSILEKNKLALKEEKDLVIIYKP